MSGAIKEQGPKTYAAMRERVEAASASEGPTTHHRGLDVAPALVSAERPRETRDVLAALTGSENKRASDVEASLHRGASGMPLGVVQALTGKAADATLPAGTLPLVNPLGVTRSDAKTAPEPSVQVLAAFADSTSGELRVEHDRRDGRHYVTADHDNGEIIVPVEVPPGVARGVAHVLRASIAAGGGSVGANEPVKQPVTAVKPSDWIDPPFMTAARAPTADVENDGHRGPLPLADLARSSAVASLVAACGVLDTRAVRLLVWIAEQLPAHQLRAACEEATATGWCRSDATDPTARRTRVDAARSALLAAVREIEGLLVGDKERTPRRGREEVLADEIERRAIGGAR